MAKKAKRKSIAKRPAKPAKTLVDERTLTKGELRKLNALRKSVGDELGDEAFAKWMKKQLAAKNTELEDKNAALIAETLMKLVDENRLKIPRGGYRVTRGRGRVVVTRTQSE